MTRYPERKLFIPTMGLTQKILFASHDLHHENPHKTLVIIDTTSVYSKGPFFRGGAGMNHNMYYRLLSL